MFEAGCEAPCLTRDIRQPGNIFVDGNGDVKLGDFGLAVVSSGGGAAAAGGKASNAAVRGPPAAAARPLHFPYQSNRFRTARLPGGLAGR